jgi:hypothetical protein
MFHEDWSSLFVLIGSDVITGAREVNGFFMLQLRGARPYLWSGPGRGLQQASETG